MNNLVTTTDDKIETIMFTHKRDKKEKPIRNNTRLNTGVLSIQFQD